MVMDMTNVRMRLTPASNKGAMMTIPYACGHPFRQFMQCNGHDKKEDMIERGVVSVRLFVQACDMVKMGSGKVKDIQEQGTGHDAEYDKPPMWGHLKGGDD